MDVFGIPIYLNFQSVVCLTPVVLGAAGSFFISLINQKTENTWYFLLMLINFAIFLFGYAFATSIFHPIGAFHRWITVFSVLPITSLFFMFIMTYSEQVERQKMRRIFLVQVVIAVLVLVTFVFRSLKAPLVFRISGHYWDFEMFFESIGLAALILCYGFVTFYYGIKKYRRMENRRNARTVLIIIGVFAIYFFPAAIMNPLSRRGVVSTEFFLWNQAVGASIVFFTFFVIFLSHTNERSTVIGNLLGITLVSVLILLPFLAYPLIEDRKEGFREIWQERLQQTALPTPDKGLVLIQGRYYRDSQQYYQQAVSLSGAENTVLRADGKGGVYTFPVTLAGTKTVVGVELAELRKYIHPTAAKLVLGQLVLILVIVTLFPLFFRGILLSPMRRLLDGVLAISRGRYGHRIENARSDELGVISRHFDKMAVTIEASTTKLEETVSQRTAQLTEEKKKSDTLLLNILPERIADELKEKGHTHPVRIESATVLFTDFVGFTKISESLTPEEVVAELDKCFSYFDQVTEKYGLEKLKTIGDSFMCAGGVPEANRTHAIDACLAALEIQAFMNQMKDIKHQQGFPYWELRLGINSGPLVAGVVGHKKFAYDVWGDTVNTASRMESSGLAGQINISKSTFDAVQKWFVCEHRGQVNAKNKGEIHMYLLKRIRPEFSRDQDGRVPNQDMKKQYVALRIGKPA